MTTLTNLNHRLKMRKIKDYRKSPNDIIHSSCMNYNLYGTFFVIGLLLLMFSAVIPFITVFEGDLEDIVYFRGVILGGILISFSGAKILNEYIFIYSLSYGVFGGLFSLLFASTFNLICDKCIGTWIYFFITFIVTGIGTIVILLYRWYYKKYHFCK